MTASVQFSLPGLPRGKGRPRFSARGGFARAYTDEKTASYEGALRLAGALAMEGKSIFEGPLCVYMVAVFPVPQSWPKKKQELAKSGALRPTNKPDLDNIMKVCDGLNGIVWHDDAQVVSATISKIYGIEPELSITVKDCID